MEGTSRDSDPHASRAAQVQKDGATADQGKDNTVKRSESTHRGSVTETRKPGTGGRGAGCRRHTAKKEMDRPHEME